MITVLDANAAVTLVLGQAKRDHAADILKKAGWVAAPSLYLYEIANTMWKYYQAGLIPQDILKEKVLDCTGLVDEFIKAEDLHEEAFNLACRLGHPAYDASYLAACLRKKAGLLSFDQRMLDTAIKLNIKCW